MMMFEDFFQPNHDFLWQALEPALAGLVLVEELGRAQGVLLRG